MAGAGEGDDEDMDMALLDGDDSCLDLDATLWARLDLFLDLHEGRGDWFTSRNMRSALALTLARSPRRLVRKCGRSAALMFVAIYSSSRGQIFTSTSLMRISVEVSTER